MNQIPETQQAAELAAVAAAAGRRSAALAEAERIAEEEIRPHAVEAARLGAGRARIRELAQVGPSTLYGWLEDAGLEIRAKRPARGRTGPDKA